VQSETKAHVEQLTSRLPCGQRFALRGRYRQHSKDAVLGTYQASQGDRKLVLLDFTKVDYINSSGIALVIQMLIEASNSGQKVYAFGLSAHLQGLHHGGHRRYAGLFPAKRRRWRAVTSGAPPRRVFVLRLGWD